MPRHGSLFGTVKLAGGVSLRQEKPVALVRPDSQHRVQPLARRLAVRTRLVDLEQNPVAGRGADADAPQEAALGHDVHLGDAGRQLGRVVIGQARDAGAELDVLRCVRAPGRSSSSGTAMFSQVVAVCSPIQASSKPSRSARTSMSRSSSNVSAWRPWGGWHGIANSPSFIVWTPWRQSAGCAGGPSPIARCSASIAAGRLVLARMSRGKDRRVADVQLRRSPCTPCRRRRPRPAGRWPDPFGTNTPGGSRCRRGGDHLARLAPASDGLAASGSSDHAGARQRPCSRRSGAASSRPSLQDRQVVAVGIVEKAVVDPRCGQTGRLDLSVTLPVERTSTHAAHS